MCDPAELELGKAQDEAIDLAETRQRLLQRANEAEAAAQAKVRGDKAVEFLKKETPPPTPFPQAPQQVPTVGRIVHYVAYGTPGGEFPAGKHRVAIITEVVNEGGVASVLDVVHLNVINPTGYFFNLNVPFDPTGKTPGTWHWPERV